MNEFAQFVWSKLQSSMLLILLALPLLTAAVVVAAAVCRKQGKRFPWRKVLLWTAMAGYLLIVLYATLLRGAGGFRSYNVHLFRAWREAWNNYSVKAWLNVLLNVAMFVPMGFLLPLLGKPFRKWYVTLTAGFGASAVIELVQLWLGKGICDVDDLFCNTLGTVIGYCAVLFLISLFAQKGKRLKGCLIYGTATGLLLGSICSIFVTYALQEYGNIPNTAAFRADTSGVRWNLVCQLPEEQEKLPVYRAQPMTKDECDDFGAAFAETFGIRFDEIMYYDKETYFMDRGAGGDGAHFLFVSYLDGSYEYTCIGKEDPVWTEGTREEIESALAQYPLAVPAAAGFSFGGDGWHSFTADKLVDGAVMLDGTLRCRYAADGKVYDIENDLIAYTYYGETAVISPEDAFNDLCAGEFSGGETFDFYHPKEIRVIGAALEYRIDTKGFYRPVYVFDLISTDGAYETRVLVNAN